MEPPLLTEPEGSVLAAAVDGVRTAVGHLVKVVDDGGLGELDPVGLVGFLAELEQVRNTWPVVDRAAIQYGIEQGVPAASTERSMARVLAVGLRLSVGEAHRRVKAAEHLAVRHALTGEVLSPVRPVLAAAQADGVVTPEQVSVIDGSLRKVDHCAPAAVSEGETLLVEAAGQLGPKDLNVVAARVVDAIDPDGVAPVDEREHHERRFFHLKNRGDGAWVGDFRLTPELGQKLSALLDPLMAPHAVSVVGGEPDRRSRGQRCHDALEDMVDRLLRSGQLPETGGTPTTVIIVMSYADYVARQGVARHGDGAAVAVPVALARADQAEVVWCAATDKGAVLALGRTRRIASRSQTLALVARDGGCSFPGCDTDPSWCERHHIVAWQDGGPTDLDNLTLLCRYHHRHFHQGGWTCRLGADRLPVWIPPKGIDPDQRPVLNPRIRLAHWRPPDPLDLT